MIPLGSPPWKGIPIYNFTFSFCFLTLKEKSNIDFYSSLSSKFCTEKFMLLHGICFYLGNLYIGRVCPVLLIKL